MCGISGFYSHNNPFSKEDLIKMTEVMKHRGPDAAGYYYEGFIGLGHRRLSIIDVSSAANQPMYSQSGRFVIVFNGEIYNFQEIKRDLLLEKQINFATSSDTEVVLEAFALWGPGFVHKLNGMFAIAIFDKNEKKLFLFRDRIGIKPIYYFYDGSCFAFSSELKGLLANDFIKNESKLNHVAINEFLHLGYIPEPHSVFEKINKFPSGHYAIISDNDFKLIKYWSPEEKIVGKYDIDIVEAKAKLKELLVSSVKYRLICDVPFGTFLSGGIDSSLVTAIAQSVNDTPVNTFSIGFQESKYNESGYAHSVAEYLGTHHHEFTVTEKDAMELIPDLINVFDEPFADSSAIPTMLVSKLARQHVTMTLSGDGGDELFMGYGAYKWARKLNNPLLKTFHNHIYSGLSKLGNKYKRAAHLFDYQNYEDIKSHIFSQEQYLFKRNEISQLLSEDIYQKISLDEHFTINNLSAASSQALFDLKYYLKDDLLVKVDRSSMKYSLETRVPILDYRIVEFALNLPEKFKINGNIQKYLLKEVLYDYVPKSYFNRPKWGFSIPLQKWLKGDLKYLIDDYLSESMLEKFQVLNKKMVADLKYRFFNKNHDYLYNRLWLLIVLQKFLEKNSL
jgi:asparagine synthase (glutamine-hydrolysing)